MNVDFRIFDEGSVIGFLPENEEAVAWFQENVAYEDWNWMGSICYVDHRSASAILKAIYNAGLTMELR